MTYIIYSMGDGAFLAEIFNAVAMLMGEDDFVYVAMIGVLLGVLLAALQTVANGGKQLSYTGPALAIVVYMALFVPRVDVMVEDVYTWSARPVDNVPLGMAAAGVIISHMSLYITEEFETAYSLPGMLQTGYSTPLEMLLAVRRVGPGTANSTNDYDNFSITLANYYKECTMTGVMLGMKNAANMVKKTDAWAALQFPSTTYTTLTHLPGDPPAGQARTCDDAYAAINAEWPNRLGLWAKNIKVSYPSVSNYETALGASLNNLVKMGLDSRQYMQNAWIMNMAEKVRAGDYVPGSFGATAVVTQASEQTQVQFAAEASVFARFARPLMTFVEGFVYSIVPFMTFAIGFGIVGFKLLSRYLLILVWVGTWMPIMSVTNLFLQMSFAKKMDALSDMLITTGSGMSPLSLMGMQTLLHQTADYVALSGTLIAATPTLGLVVIYGGAYTMVSMANKIVPQDTIDEKMASPDLMTNSSLVNMSSSKQYDPTLGTRASGFEGTTPSLDLSQAASRNVASSKSRMEAASANFSSTFTQGLQSLRAGGVSSSEAQRVSQQLGLGSENYQGTKFAVAADYMRKNGYTDSETNAVLGQMALSAAGGGGVGYSGRGSGHLKAGAEMKMMQRWSNEIQDLVSNDEGLKSIISDGGEKGTKQALKQGIQLSAESGDVRTWDMGFKGSVGQRVDAAKSNLASARKEYTEAEQFSQSGGVSQSVNMLAMAQQATRSPEMMKRIATFQNSNDEEGNRITRRTNDIVNSGYVTDRDQAHALAAMEVMQSTMDTNPNASDALVDLAVASGLVARGVAPEGIDPRANAGLASGLSADDKSVKGAALAARGAGQGRLASARAGVATVPGNAGQHVDSQETTGHINQAWGKMYKSDNEIHGGGRAHFAAVPGALKNIFQKNNGTFDYQYDTTDTPSSNDKQMTRSMVFSASMGMADQQAAMRAIYSGDTDAMMSQYKSARGQTVTADELPELRANLLQQNHAIAVSSGLSGAQADKYAHQRTAGTMSVVEDNMVGGKLNYDSFTKDVSQNAIHYAVKNAQVAPQYERAVRDEIQANPMVPQEEAQRTAEGVSTRVSDLAAKGPSSLYKETDDLRTVNIGLDIKEPAGYKDRLSGHRPSLTGVSDMDGAGPLS